MSKKSRGKDKKPPRDMFVRINIEDAALGTLVNKIRAAKYQVREGGGYMPYTKGVGMPVTGRAGDQPIHYYLTPVGAGPTMRAIQGYSDPGQIAGLDYIGESMDYFKFGYMNRATRSVLSAIPGMSQILYGAYRTRAMMVEFARGTGGPLFSHAPFVSGQDWSMGNLPPNVQATFGKFTGFESIPQGGAAMLNWHPLAAVGVGLVVASQFLRRMDQETKALNADAQRRMRASMDDMSEGEYLRWAKRNNLFYKGVRPW